MYLIKEYQFPYCETVTDPTPQPFLEGGYLYIHSQLYTLQSKSDHGKGLTSQPDGEPDYAVGRVFFDKETELVGFADAQIRGTQRFSHDNPNGEGYYLYSCVAPDAKLTFVAELGNRRAAVAYYNSQYVISCGGTRKLAVVNSKEDNSEYVAYLVIVFFGALIFLLKSRRE